MLRKTGLLLIFYLFGQLVTTDSATRTCPESTDTRKYPKSCPFWCCSVNNKPYCCSEWSGSWCSGTITSGKCTQQPDIPDKSNFNITCNLGGMTQSCFKSGSGLPAWAGVLIAIIVILVIAGVTVGICCVIPGCILYHARQQ